MAASGGATIGLFLLLWWVLHDNGDELPWVPAALAASIVMLAATAAREVLMRRAWTRSVLELDRREHAQSAAGYTSGPTIATDGNLGETHGATRRAGRSGSFSAALRELQHQAAEAERTGASPEAHLEIYHACLRYLASTDEALRNGASAEARARLRAGQERARQLQKRHLIEWARRESIAITSDARRRPFVSGKIETASRAIDVLDAALKIYPEEPDLVISRTGVREFIASVKVARWVELAERATFKGKYKRALDYYRDALFDLSREAVEPEAQREISDRIGREIDRLRARLRIIDAPADNQRGRRRPPPNEKVKHAPALPKMP